MLVLILVAVVGIVLVVLGYLWYITKKSPSIVNGGYDNEMRLKANDEVKK